MAILLILSPTLALVPFSALAKTVDELRQELQQKQDSLKSTEEKIRQFKQSIQEKRQQAHTLQDQIGLIDDNIQEISLDIQKTEQEIEKTGVEIESIEKDIQAKEEEIARQKEMLADYLRALYRFDQQSTVAILLKYNTFSEAVNESATIAELQSRAQQTLNTIQALHEELVNKRQKLADFKQSLEALQTRQQREQDILTSQRNSKQHILDLTKSQETQYQGLLQEAQRSQREAEATISELDSKIREELRQRGIGNLPAVGVMDWPIEPIFGIACGFHCAGYPYQYLIGPHTGIDIPTYVGTPIKAPADGYVGRTHDSGGTGYSYILLIHGDNISTVYGHVSGFAVSEGRLVTRGTVIGYTGGAPGSHGSGLSTGPHLHFEVRQNNIPVDPMNFLASR